jgi:predicted DNA-binding transcriptional regulator AlpA
MNPRKPPVEEQDDRLIKASEVARLLDCSIRSVWRWASMGKIPKPVEVAPFTTRWRLSEIMAIVRKQPSHTT